MISKIFLIFRYLFCICFMSINSSGQVKNLQSNPFNQNYFGINVQDDYRFLEKENDSIINWYKANSIYSSTLLNQISGKKDLLNLYRGFENRKKFRTITSAKTINNNNFSVRNYSGETSSKLYYKSSNSKKEILLFDSKDYKKEANITYLINYVKPSWDNKWLVICFVKKGQEIGEIAVLDLKSKKLMDSIIPNVWPSELWGVNWLPDNSGYIYTQITDYNPKSQNYLFNCELTVYYLDSSRGNKILFSHQNNPEIKSNPQDFPLLLEYSYGDKFLLLSVIGASEYYDCYAISTETLKKEIPIKWMPIYKKEESLLRPTLYKDDIYCMSSKNAKNYKIIKWSINNKFEKPEIIINEFKEDIISEFLINKHGIFYTTIKNGVVSKLHQKPVNSKNSKEINLPIPAGSIRLSTIDKNQSKVELSISGWLTNNQKFNYDVTKNTFEKLKIGNDVEYPEFNNFKVLETEVISNDTVKIPISIIYNQELIKNGENYVFLDGYGSYGLNYSPALDPMKLSWVINGGIIVIAHVRGGGEKGEEWHQQGFKKTKSNSWKDMITVAEYLIKERICSNSNIAISGESAGGITVGMAAMSRPDLFKVLLCNRGIVNPLRINEAPNGPNNMREFGDPTIEEEFKYLLEMDPYHSIKKKTNYPAVLVSIGMDDARIAPWMSGKFVSKLRDHSTSNLPIVLSIGYDSGHGTDLTDSFHNDYANEFAFAFWQLGHPNFKLKN